MNIEMINAENAEISDIFESYEELSRRAAGIIAAQVISKPESILGLATGSSPVGTYKELINLNILIKVEIILTGKDQSPTAELGDS